MKYKDYKILESYTSAECLMTSVNVFLKNGYTLIGGVAVYGSGQNSSNRPYVYIQAVAKIVEDETWTFGPR